MLINKVNFANKKQSNMNTLMVKTISNYSLLKSKTNKK
jgi:hypothetical protein